MSVKNAKDFIRRTRSDSTFRSILNQSSSADEVSDILSSEELIFTEDEFVEAYSYMLANSVSQEKTEELQEFLQWYRLINC